MSQKYATACNSGCYRRQSSFTFYTTDCDTGHGLPSVCYCLYACDHLVSTAISNEQGLVNFPNLNHGEYTLIQVAPPCKYEPLTNSWPVCVDPGGIITVAGCEVQHFRPCNTQCACASTPDPCNQNHRVYVIDFDVTNSKVLKYDILLVTEGYNITMSANQFSGYQLISPCEQTFYNVRSDLNWTFQYQKLDVT